MELTTLPPSCADFLEIWEPNLLGPSGPVQACHGIALFTLQKVTFAALGSLFVTLHVTRDIATVGHYIYFKIIISINRVLC